MMVNKDGGYLYLNVFIFFLRLRLFFSPFFSCEREGWHRFSIWPHRLDGPGLVYFDKKIEQVNVNEAHLLDEEIRIWAGRFNYYSTIYSSKWDQARLLNKIIDRMNRIVRREPYTAEI